MAESAEKSVDQPLSPQDSQPAPVQIEVDDLQVISAYANFCRATGTPEELVIDFGLTARPFGDSVHPIRITQRIVLNYYTAKRLFQVLGMTIQRHEAAFGVVETDIQKRLLPPGAGGSAASPPTGP